MSDKFELFDAENRCEAGLPVNIIKDEFTFIGFAPLYVKKGKGTPKPVVVPRDYVNPGLMRKVRFELGATSTYVPDDFIRGVPFNPEWKEWVDPWDEIDLPQPTPNGGIFIIPDIDKFIAQPKIKLGEGRAIEITISRNNIRDLRFKGATSLTITSGERQARVNLIARKPGRTGRIAGMPSRLLSVNAGNARLTIPSVGNLPQVFEHLDKALDQFAPPKLDFVLCLPYRQVWKLLGYSRGELLNTISLAPEEETTIEIKSWDKLTTSSEENVQSGREGVLEASFTDKDTLQTIKDTTEENNWNFNAKFQPNIPIGGVPVQIGEIGGGQEHKLTDVNKATRDKISEAVRKSSLKVTSSRQTKVTETKEIGREDKVTRKIKNPNMCHTLNLDYFEVLGAYEITTALERDQVRLCVLVPNLINDKINRNFILNHLEVLRHALLYGGKDHAGFAAAKKLAAWEKLCLVKCKEPCPCEEATPEKTGATAPPVQGDNPAATELLRAVIRLQNSLNALVTANLNDFCARGGDEESYHHWLYWQIATNYNASLASATSTFLGGLARVNFTDTSNETMNQIEPLIEDFVGYISQSLLESLVGILTFSSKMMLDYLVAAIEHLPCVIKLVFRVGVDDANLPREIQRTRTALRNYQNSIVAGAANPPQSGADNSDPLSDAVTEVYSDQEIAEALVDEKALLVHIQNNESYYRQTIWESLGANDQLRLLSLLGRISSFVELEVLGFIGNKIVMPYRIENDSQLNAWLDTQKQQFLDEEDNTQTLTLPTKGVMLESRLGKCGSCEPFIVEHRKKDLRQKEAEVKASEQKAEQEELETKRYETRLEQDPPLLDDPDPNENDQPVIRVILEKNNDG